MQPYVGYWPAGTTFANAQWFQVTRNQYIDVAIPNWATPFQLNFHVIVDLYR